mmetsp:Transcript_65552/g.154845  ORF Transcript_65552/g.154845 Transcript_65552/m.154845 type:complete len:363 (-) Transcript_65552:653-1741(-)
MHRVVQCKLLLQLLALAHRRPRGPLRRQLGLVQGQDLTKQLHVSLSQLCEFVLHSPLLQRVSDATVLVRLKFLDVVHVAVQQPPVLPPSQLPLPRQLRTSVCRLPLQVPQPLHLGLHCCLLLCEFCLSLNGEVPRLLCLVCQLHNLRPQLGLLLLQRLDPLRHLLVLVGQREVQVALHHAQFALLTLHLIVGPRQLLLFVLHLGVELLLLAFQQLVLLQRAVVLRRDLLKRLLVPLHLRLLLLHLVDHLEPLHLLPPYLDHARVHLRPELSHVVFPSAQLVVGLCRGPVDHLELLVEAEVLIAQLLHQRLQLEHLVLRIQLAILLGRVLVYPRLLDLDERCAIDLLVLENGFAQLSRALKAD